MNVHLVKTNYILNLFLRMPTVSMCQLTHLQSVLNNIMVIPHDPWGAEQKIPLWTVQNNVNDPMSSTRIIMKTGMK